MKTSIASKRDIGTGRKILVILLSCILITSLLPVQAFAGSTAIGTQATDISSATLSTIYEQTWTGSAITPEPTVTYSGTPLVKDTDYTLSYTNNVNLGTATVTATGIGSYTGSVSKDFTITPFVYHVVTDGSGSFGNGAYITGMTGGITDVVVPVTLGGANVASVYIAMCGITSLDVSANTQLVQLVCGSNQLTALDVSANTQLVQLVCDFNQLTALDASANTLLDTLYCGSNQLTSLDVSANTQLTRLVCYHNQLTSLDVSANTQLAQLDCDSNQLTSLDASANTQLTQLVCGNNQLTALDVSANALLNGLFCYDNQLVSLDISANTLLSTLYCNDNQLTALDISANTLLDTLYCNNNYIVDTSALEAWLATSGHSGQILPQLTDISTATLSTIYEQTWTGSAITPEPVVTYSGTPLVKDTDYTLSYTNNVDLGTATVNVTGIGSFGGTKSENFTITPFVYTVVTDGSGAYGNGTYITDVVGTTTPSVPATLGGASVVSVRAVVRGLTSLDVSAAVTLRDLYCEQNLLTTLDVSSNTELRELICNLNSITSLDVSANTDLTLLACDHNALIALDVSNNAVLTELHCNYNALASLNLSGASALKWLDCNTNMITSLDVSSSTLLEWLDCDTNQIRALDLSNNLALGVLYCYNNALISLDTSANSLLTDIYCNDNSIIHTSALENWLSLGYSGQILPQNSVDIAGAVVTLTPDTYDYTGSAITPAPVLTYSNGADTVTLIEGTDYTPSYSDNVNMGTATITIAGMGNCTGSTSATFDIVARNIADASVAPISDVTYTGSAITPEPTVTYSGTPLVKDADYTLGYADNVNLGTATVTVTGIGSFSGTLDATFNIIPKSIASSVIAPISKKLYVGVPVEPTLAVTDGATTLALGVDYTKSYTNNTVNGTATATITGIGNYTATNSTDFTVVRFSDVSYDMWYITDGWLTYVVENDLMSGYAGTTEFGPLDFISRGQVATILYRAACNEDPSLIAIYGSTIDPSNYATTAVFDDEATGVYYTAAINWAKAVGVMTGYGPEYTHVAPDNLISREELCAMITRYVRVIDPVKGAQTGPVDYSHIQGMDEVSDWALANVEWCASWGIIGGVNSGGGVFVMNPRDAAWRASMAKMITISIRDVIG